MQTIPCFGQALRWFYLQLFYRRLEFFSGNTMRYLEEVLQKIGQPRSNSIAWPVNAQLVVHASG
jgi:hypothetical protein